MSDVLGWLGTTADTMPDDCHDGCADGRAYFYPYAWVQGLALYECDRGHFWTCSWGTSRSGLDLAQRRKAHGETPTPTCTACGAESPEPLCRTCSAERRAHRRVKAKARRAAFIARNGCTCDTGSCTRCRIYADERKARP